MKKLITSGCSFSTCWVPGETWPSHLEQRLDGFQAEHYGMGSQGNGLISRSIIHAVSKALLTMPAEDILVGVMWSGAARHDYFVLETENLSISDKNNTDGWLENPTGFIPGATKNWVIINNGWKFKEAKLYSDYFWDPLGCVISTFEHILRTQWFLKQYNIKYFFTCYTDYVFGKNIWKDIDTTTNVHTKYLNDMLDFDNFLPVNSISSWLTEKNILPVLTETSDHPTRDQHIHFVDKVIIPHLKNKKYI